LFNRSMSVRLRLMLWNVGILAFILIAVGVVVRITTQAAISASVDRELEQRSNPFVQRWFRFDRDRRFAPRWYREGLTRPPGPPQDVANAFVRFWPRTLDTLGRPYLPWANDRPWDHATVAASAQGRQVSTSIWVDGEHIRVRSFPLYNNDRQIVGVMQVASSLADMDQALTSLTVTMLALSPFVLLACGLAGAVITGRAMGPVRTIVETSSRIGAGNLSERLPIIGSDDFAELAVTMNGMLGRLDDAFRQLEQAFEQQIRFTADASHELRTPLTAIKGNVSLALTGDRPAADYRKALEDTNRATDNMSHIVQELLFLARSDAKQLKLDLRVIDVRELLQDAVDAVHGLEQPTILIETPDFLPRLYADPNHLLRILVNLLVNALRHTPVTGAISLAAHVEDSEFIIRVTDTGEGIPPEHLPHLTERFYRADASRVRSHGGTGLGLAICQCIVDAHGGTLGFVSAVGVGTIVTVTLPYSDDVPSF
jgi:heavy metal sensor kinase